MGIKSLTQSIKKSSPDSIIHDNLYKLSGKKVAVDASLIIYQNLLNIGNRPLFKNSKGKITNHLSGLFYKIVNYLSMNIELIFIFDGKPPSIKSDTIKDRKNKSNNAKQKMESASTQEDKDKYEKASLRLTKEMIDDVKKLLNLMGVSYIHPEGEGEDIVSIFDYNQIINGFELTPDQFIEFCILCGCDYCDSVSKIGNITALKLIKQYKTVEEIIKNTKYMFPENYLDLFKQSKAIFYLWKDKIDINEIKINKSQKNIAELIHFLVGEIEMNEKKVHNGIKKIMNVNNFALINN